MSTLPTFDSERTVPVRCTRRGCAFVTFFAPTDPTAGHVCESCCRRDAAKLARTGRGSK